MRRCGRGVRLMFSPDDVNLESTCNDCTTLKCDIQSLSAAVSLGPGSGPSTRTDEPNPVDFIELFRMARRECVPIKGTR